MPIQTYNSSGGLIFDSNLVNGTISLGVYQIPSNSSFSKSWPELQGMTISAYDMFGYGYDAATNIDPASVLTVSQSPPSISASPYVAPRTVMVVASGTPAAQNVAGMFALNASGQIGLSPSGRGLVYIGQASVVGYQNSTWDYDGAVDEYYGQLGYTKLQVTSPTQPIAFTSLPEGVTLIDPPVFINVSGNLWEAWMQAVATTDPFIGGSTGWAALYNPAVYCFAATATPGGGASCAVYDSNGALAYDLMAGKLLATAGSGALVPTGGSIGGPGLTSPGIFGKARYQGVTQGRFSDTENIYYGGWYRSGSTYAVRSCCTEVNISPPPYPGPSISRYYAYSSSLVFTDLAQY